MNYKNIFIGVFISVLSLFSPVVLFAQTDERAQLEDELLVKLPEESDNPNYTITFVDPSESGVFLSIDSATKKEIKNPYQLPSLGVGKHTLLFEYTDKLDSTQTIETNIVIIPRPPVINAPEISEGKIAFTGTGMPASNLHFILTGSTDTFERTIEVDNEGDWELSLDDSFKDSIYTSVAFVKKDGYASNYSEPVRFALEKTSPISTEGNQDASISYTLKSLFDKGVVTTLKDNQDLLITFGILTLLGFIVGVILTKLFDVKSERAAEKVFVKMLNHKDKDKKEAEKVAKKADSKTEKDDTIASKLKSSGLFGKKKKTEEEGKDVTDEVEVEGASNEPSDDEEAPLFEATDEVELDDLEKEEESDSTELEEDIPEEEDVPEYKVESKDDEAGEDETEPDEIVVDEAEQKGEDASNTTEDSEESSSDEENDTDEISKEKFLDKFEDADPDPDDWDEDINKLEEEESEELKNDEDRIKGLKALLQSHIEQESESDLDEDDVDIDEPSDEEIDVDEDEEVEEKPKRSKRKSKTTKKKGTKSSTKKSPKAKSSKKTTKKKPAANKTTKKSTKKRGIKITLTSAD